MLNRRFGGMELFEKPSDYKAFEQVLTETHERTDVRIAAYCVMPNIGTFYFGPEKTVNCPR